MFQFRSPAASDIMRIQRTDKHNAYYRYNGCGSTQWERREGGDYIYYCFPLNMALLQSVASTHRIQMSFVNIKLRTEQRAFFPSFFFKNLQQHHFLCLKYDEILGYMCNRFLGVLNILGK